jgi:hypothetical protein
MDTNDRVKVEVPMDLEKKLKLLVAAKRSGKSLGAYLDELIDLALEVLAEKGDES